MEIGKASAGYKWIVDANHNDIPEKAEIGKQAEDAFSLPLTAADCATLGITLTEEYSIENANDIIVAINKIGLEADLLFHNADQLLQQKSYPAAQAEYDRAGLRYGDVLELYTVLIAIAKSQATDTFNAALPGFIKKSELIQQNIKAAKANSATAVAAQERKNLIEDDNAWIARYQQIEASYNKGVVAFNEKRFADALAILTSVENESTVLLVTVTELEKKYPQHDFSARRKDTQELLDLTIQLKAETTTKIK